MQKPGELLEKITTIEGTDVIELEEDLRKSLEPKIKRLEEWRRRSLEDARVRVLH